MGGSAKEFQSGGVGDTKGSECRCKEFIANSLYRPPRFPLSSTIRQPSQGDRELTHNGTHIQRNFADDEDLACQTDASNAAETPDTVQETPLLSVTLSDM